MLTVYSRYFILFFVLSGKKKIWKKKVFVYTLKVRALQRKGSVFAKGPVIIYRLWEGGRIKPNAKLKSSRPFSFGPQNSGKLQMQSPVFSSLADHRFISIAAKNS